MCASVTNHGESATQMSANETISCYIVSLCNLYISLFFCAFHNTQALAKTNVLPTMKLLKTFTFLPLLFFGVEATEHHGTVELSLMNSVGNKYGDEYYVNLTVGTPGQLQSVLIDTGSSSTIFLASDVPGCNKTLCPQTFNLSASSSFDAVSPGALYAPFGGAAALGDFVTDVVQIGTYNSKYSSRDSSANALRTGSDY
jgi:hypothetical protein